MKHIDLVVIGGGSAGMAAALSAHAAGLRDILILEQDEELGGILQQCIHNGFGLQIFKEELSGPSFAQRYIDKIETENIPYYVNTTVLQVTKDKVVTYVNSIQGYTEVQAKAVILACGCYERSRGAISIPGDRGKGIYTAGCAQRYVNIDNVMPGKKVFILGSGDIGLIMARRMTLEGAEVLGVAEVMPYSNGLQRNIVQCLEDFQIPLYLSHTITNIKGKDTVKEIKIMEVDENRKPIAGTEKVFEADTLLLSVGLIPDTTLAQTAQIEIDPRTKGAIVDEHYQTSIPGVYACGNALHVHDLVDFVCMEAEKTGRFAAEGMLNESEYCAVYAGEDISYVIPQRVHKHTSVELTLCFRVKRPLKNCVIELYCGNELIKKIPKRYVLPAEMEKVILSKTCNINDSIEVRVVK